MSWIALEKRKGSDGKLPYGCPQGPVAGPAVWSRRARSAMLSSLPATTSASLPIPGFGVEYGEPVAKCSQLLRAEILNLPFNLFNPAHRKPILISSAAQQGESSAAQFASSEKLRPQIQPAVVVHGQHVDGRPAGWREPFDACAAKLKVFNPAVAAWMK
jgi:hypothetical protein